MKKLFTLSKVKLGVIVALATALVGAGLLQHSLAATGQIYLSPGSASVQNGQTTTLSVYINPGTAVDGVEATVTYDQSKLQFVSADAGGSAFPVQLQQSGGGGSVQISRGILGGSVSSNSFVVKVTFKALAGSGSTNVNVSGNATSGGNYTNPGGGSATVALTTPVTSTPKPAPSNPPSDSGSDDSSGDSGNSSGDTGGNEAPGEKPRDQAGKVEICNRRVEFTKVILCVSANKRVRVYIKYGSDEKQLRLSSKATKHGTKHDVNLDDKFLIPGTTYYYQVIAEDEQGNKTISPVQNLKTKGYTITILIKDRREQPFRKKQVTLHSEPQTATTDDNGWATFEDVAPGTHTLEYEQDGQKYTESVNVEDALIKTAKDGSQNAETLGYNVNFVNLAAVKTTPDRTLTIYIAGAVSALALLGAGIFILIRRRRQQNPFAVTSGAGAPAQYGTPPTNPDELIHKAPGVHRPDPGSIVTPNRDDEEDQK
jgi:hypothetical protein